MAPALPTVMKAGVRTTPCGVVRRPARAWPSVASNSKWLASVLLGSVMGRLMAYPLRPAQPRSAQKRPQLPLTAPPPAHMVRGHDDRENHDQNQKALGGFGSRAHVKVNGRHHPNRAPPDQGPGLFYCLQASPNIPQESKVADDPVVAIAGVTGAVGREFMATMDKRGFRVGKLKALASARSAGKRLSFRGQEIVVEELTADSFEGVDIALFSAGSGISKTYSPIAVKAGAVVIDNSSAFRMDRN